jgi:hypothetical protein
VTHGSTITSEYAFKPIYKQTFILVINIKNGTFNGTLIPWIHWFDGDIDWLGWWLLKVCNEGNIMCFL